VKSAGLFCGFVIPLRLVSDRFPNDLQMIREIELDYRACFCSIYDQCWQIEEDEDGRKLLCGESDGKSQ